MSPDFGVMPTDGLLVAALGEMKVDYERMNKAAYLQESSYVPGGLYGPLLGGYAGGPAETALILLSHFYLGLLVFGVQWSCCFPIHIRETCNSTRELLWLVSLTSQALSRNSHLLYTMNAFQAAGPCTRMVTRELAAHAIAATVSGASLHPAAPARNKYPERCTGMEVRIQAEIGHAVARSRLRRSEADAIVKTLLSEYEGQISTAPIGKKFSECYDLKTLKPSAEYLELYSELKRGLAEASLPVEA